MRKTIILAIVLCVLPVWWIFQILWLPGYMHALADFSYHFSPIQFSTQTAASARDRAYEYATHGGGQSNDIYFTHDEISHLNDVSRLFKPLQALVSVLAIIAWSVLILAIYKKVNFEKELMLSAKILTGLLIASALCLVGFSFFFEKFHEVLFPQGNWAFPADSLLITIFPEVFWKLELGSIVSFLLLFIALYILLAKRAASNVKV